MKSWTFWISVCLLIYMLITLSTGSINLPKSNAYANEIRYFADCVISDTFPDKVKPDELETVIDILNNIK